jgi:hypothetical protein
MGADGAWSGPNRCVRGRHVQGLGEGKSAMSKEWKESKRSEGKGIACLEWAGSRCQVVSHMGFIVPQEHWESQRFYTEGWQDQTNTCQVGLWQCGEWIRGRSEVSVGNQREVCYLAWVSVLVNFISAWMCLGFLNIWINVISESVCGAFLEVINIWISGLDKTIALPDWVAIFSSLRAWGHKEVDEDWIPFLPDCLS